MVKQRKSKNIKSYNANGSAAISSKARISSASTVFLRKIGP
jgi:hypothetical protein